MAITAQQVNELRKKTGAGMMDCKKALTEADGDMEKAIENLRKKGASVAAKRAERSANEGIVMTKVSDDNRFGAMVEVNCETDFVAKSDDFVNFANSVLEKTFEVKPDNAEDLLEKESQLKENLVEITGKVGEKTEISRVKTISSENGMVIDYIHPGSKLGVMVLFDNVPAEKMEDFSTIGRDLAMQVAAMRPIAVGRDDVDKDIIEKELDIYKEIAKKEGKPEQILEKIAQGKLNKFFQENCLTEQAYIKDNSKTIKELVAEFNKANNTEIVVSAFLRFHLGDENK